MTGRAAANPWRASAFVGRLALRVGGIEIMDWLLRNRVSTSVIVFSAADSIDSAIHALRQGAFEFVRKHCDPDELIQTVDRALRRAASAHPSETSR